MKRMTCVVMPAAIAGVALGAAVQPAMAEPISTAALSDLQIAISAPGAVSEDSTVALDVNFHGGNVRSVELFMDGKLLMRKAIRTREGYGVITFALDGALLSEGAHEVLIKAYDPRGNVATATSNLRITPGDENALVRFLNLKRNAVVQGVVPLEIGLDRSIHTPYVMFFVDNDFLALTNYAPYTYNWDSTHVPNGMHTLSIKTYDGDTTAEIQTLHLQVNVNNPGGFTALKTEIPDLSNPAPARKNKVASNSAQSALPEMGIEPADLTGGLVRILHKAINRDDARSAGAARESMPGFPNLLRADSFPIRGLASPFALPTPRPVPPEHDAVRTLRPTSAKVGLLNFLAQPTESRSLGIPPALLPARQAAHPYRAGNVAVRPDATWTVAPVAANMHGKPANPNQAAPSAMRALVGSASLSNRNGKTFAVAFDDTQIAFDVQPRIENGLPLAPFRQIFEHTGGIVQWFGKSKTVRAVNSTHEIVFRIGSRNARVNNQPLKMQAKPYIERGRAIVPLSFVRDSLDVNVQFDPSSGHLRIESKK